ncbi:MAG: hypothetical protein IJT94_12155 [Oscillibacter sp.]|nr:hypothetical protein [Oscillibacter sp.]
MSGDAFGGGMFAGSGTMGNGGIFTGSGTSTGGGACPRGNCADCGGCSGGTGSGCPGGNTLFLTEGEIAVLRRFGEIPFWPVCRTADGEEPVCREEGMADGAALSALSLKGLIRLDFDQPLSNFDYAPYAAFPHHGSMALTARGQGVLEAQEIQGAEEPEDF